jgi:hypothetical protein
MGGVLKSNMAKTIEVLTHLQITNNLGVSPISIPVESLSCGLPGSKAFLLLSNSHKVFSQKDINNIHPSHPPFTYTLYPRKRHPSCNVYKLTNVFLP